MNVMSPQAETIPEPYCVEIDWGVPHSSDLPSDTEMIDWIGKTLQSQEITDCEVAVRIMASSEMALLNQQFRSKSGTTNVLSFPAGQQSTDGRILLGDIAVCLDVVRAEAAEQGKPVAAHLAHMLVHGVLHLLGFDHETLIDANKMEPIEVELMADFGFPDPYGPERKEDTDRNE